jgi:hypothetical protein
MLIIFHVAAETPSTEYPHDAGPVATAKDSMTMMVKNLINKFGHPTKLLISPYHISLQTYLLVKPIFDTYEIKTIMREPKLSKFISSKIPSPTLRQKTIDGQGQYASKLVGETEENFKKRVRECYTNYFREASEPGVNVWLLTHSDVMEYIASLIKFKFTRPTDYHSYLAIPRKGDILAGDIPTRGPAPQNTFVYEPVLPIASSLPSSSSRIEESQHIEPRQSEARLPQPKPNPRMTSRAIVEMKARQKREERKMRDAIVGYPKKGGFRPYESSSSSSDSSSDSSDSSEDDLISQRASDLLAMTVAGGTYRPPAPHQFQTRTQSRQMASPYDPSNTEAAFMSEREPMSDRRRPGKRPGQLKRPTFELTRYGEDFEDEYLNDGDLESIR